MKDDGFGFTKCFAGRGTFDLKDISGSRFVSEAFGVEAVRPKLLYVVVVKQKYCRVVPYGLSEAARDPAEQIVEIEARDYGVVDSEQEPGTILVVLPLGAMCVFVVIHRLGYRSVFSRPF